MSTDALKSKIAALRRKTTSAGCTEAEAMAAAELAAKLMAEAGLHPDDVEMTEASAPEETKRTNWRMSLVSAIAAVTNTAVMLTTSRRERVGAWLFMGLAPGPEIAVYLRDVCFRAVATEVARFKAGTFYRRRRSVATRRQAVADFTDGLVARLSLRLMQLFASSRSQHARRLADAAMSRRFPDTKDIAIADRKTRFGDAGWSAGGKVPLHHGVGAAGAPRAITGGQD